MYGVKHKLRIIFLACYALGEIQQVFASNLRYIRGINGPFPELCTLPPSSFGWTFRFSSAFL
ncbi:MAG TPA: hypothetical protein VF742_00760, partial [Terracidiphilus sp.]